MNAMSILATKKHIKWLPYKLSNTNDTKYNLAYIGTWLQIIKLWYVRYVLNDYSPIKPSLNASGSSSRDSQCTITELCIHQI